MREKILRITAVILCGLIAGIGWSVGSPRQLGEVVPDEVAAAQRGGETIYACSPRDFSRCPIATTNNSECTGKLVYMPRPGPELVTQCDIWCGLTTELCAQLPLYSIGPCSKTGQ